MYAFLFALLLGVAAQASDRSLLRPVQNIPITDELPTTTPPGSSFRLPDNPLDEIFLAGTTWFDRQHLGTSGRMIGVDELGFAHVVWTRGSGNPPNVNRHVYYNVFDPAANSFLFEGGTMVDYTSRAGYASLALDPAGICFPAFNYFPAWDSAASAAIAFDFLPRAGVFVIYEPMHWSDVPGINIIWPKVARDRQGRLHVVATENSFGSQRIFYARGVPDSSTFEVEILFDTWSDGNQWWMLDTVTTVSANVVSSRQSDRVAIVYSRSRDDLNNNPTQVNNDLYVIYSEDGGDHWGEPVNVTQFEYPDFDCPGGDIRVCDRDTFRVFNDNSAIFDNTDVLHIAFTTGYYFQIENEINVAYSDIWHWDEQTNYFSNIAHGSFVVTDSILWRDPGEDQRMLQKPSLAIDTVTWGEMYCTFQRFDTLQASQDGWPQAEIYVAASPIIVDSDWITGVHWMEAVNISNTNGGVAAPPGESRSEGDITVAEYVVRENFEPKLYLSYELDRDVGATATENPIYVMRIPTDSCNSHEPHNVGYPSLRIDSTGYPPPYLGIHADDRRDLLREFTLHENFPNPFNSSTTIQFDLARDAEVSLRVFDVQGRLTSALIASQSFSAGVHTLSFDATTLSSGVYFYRLETATEHQTRKMVLLK